MDEKDFLARRFEENRARLRSVAYRMLGSLGEADDAVQEAWLRLVRSDADDIENLGGWLTAVVGRVCLDMLRSRKSRREESMTPFVPDPVVERDDDPEHEALLADSVGLALLSVLETLSPAERLAFVLHDVFAVPFEEVSTIVNRSPEAARKLASRARHRVRGAEISPDTDFSRQREVVSAFLSAARDGNFDALLSILDPDVILRADYGGATPVAGREARGATAVANEASTFTRLADPNLVSRPALVNGVVGRVVSRDGRPFSVMGFTVVRGRISRIDILADPERLRQLDLSALDD